MPTFQARIIRQEVAITDVEGDTIETAKEKLRAIVPNGSLRQPDSNGRIGSWSITKRRM